MASPADHELVLSEADSSKEKGQVFGILRLQEEKSGSGDKANMTARGGGGSGGGGDGRWQAPIFALARKASETISGSIHVLPKVSDHRTSLPGDWAVQGREGIIMRSVWMRISGLITPRKGVFFFIYIFWSHAVINVEYQRLANHAASCYLDSGASVCRCVTIFHPWFTFPSPACVIFSDQIWNSKVQSVLCWVFTQFSSLEYWNILYSDIMPFNSILYCSVY